MPRYNADQFDPPAPVAQVQLRNLQNPRLVASALMLIDSGADVTLVPLAAITAIGLAVNTEQGYELSGFDGQESLAYPVSTELTVAGRSFRGQYLVIDQPWGIIGRNLLNLLRVALDGPRLEWTAD